MSSIKKSIFIKCDEANHCCDKAQYNEASVKEKLKMIVHLSFCKKCRNYTSINSKLTRIIKKSRLQNCSDGDKANWKEQIKQELSKGSV